MTSIPANYNGHTFRSLMEARWAVFFDYFGFKWDYEPHGFESGDGKYLPDFYIREFDVYVEVKYKNDAHTTNLSRRFAVSQGIDIIICDGNPHIRPLPLFAGSDKKGHLGMDSKVLWYYKKGEGLAYCAETDSPRPEYKEAVLKANAQRFGVMEIKGMLGQARKAEAIKLQGKLLHLMNKYNIEREEIDNVVKSIKEFNQAACLRAFHEVYKNEIDGLTFKHAELTDNFNYNKGL